MIFFLSQNCSWITENRKCSHRKRFTIAFDPQNYYDMFKKQMQRNGLNQVLEAKKTFQGPICERLSVVCQILMKTSDKHD